MRRGAKGKWQLALPAPRAARGVGQASSCPIAGARKQGDSKYCNQEETNGYHKDTGRDLIAGIVFRTAEYNCCSHA